MSTQGKQIGGTVGSIGGGIVWFLHLVRLEQWWDLL